MNFKERIELLKKAFSVEEEVKMMEAKSKDGAILNIEPALEKGAKVFVVTEEGKSPAANGELILEDGTVLICEGGAIQDIKPAEEKEEGPAKEQAPNEMESKFAAELGSLKELFEATIKTISERLEKIEQGFASKSEVDEVKKFSKEILEVVVGMAGEPNEAPAEKPKQGFSAIKAAKKSYQDELKKFKRN